MTTVIVYLNMTYIIIPTYIRLAVQSKLLTELISV